MAEVRHEGGPGKAPTHLRRVGSSICPPPRSTAVPRLSYIVPNYPVLPRTPYPVPQPSPENAHLHGNAAVRVASVSLPCHPPQLQRPLSASSHASVKPGVAGPDSHLPSFAKEERPLHMRKVVRICSRFPSFPWRP